MAFWVYLLRCADNSYYIGHTDDSAKRIAEHQTGAIPGCYTAKRRPVQLVFSQDFPTREEAVASERQIKGWNRKKKEAIIRGDWAEVSRLAKSKTVLSESSRCRVIDKPSTPNTVCPELVQGREPLHPSTGSGRTGGGRSS